MDLFKSVNRQYEADLQWDYDHSRYGSITLEERISGLANRFLYSTAYKVFYLFLAALSVICLIYSLNYGCPTGMVLALEIIINVALVIEVAIRMAAQRMQYFSYLANWLDLVLVILCIVTLSYLGSTCTSGSQMEETFESVLLIVRNSVQFFRLFVVMKKGNTGQRFVNIEDLESAEYSYGGSRNGLGDGAGDETDF